MLTRRRRKLIAIHPRRWAVDEYHPAEINGPVFLRYPHRDDWRQGDLVPKCKVNGRWLPAMWASRIRWLNSIAHKGSRRGDPRQNKLQTAARRCLLRRYTELPF